MTVLSVKPQFGKLTGPVYFADWHREWSDTYVVLTTEGTTGVEVMADSRVPIINDRQPNDPDAVVTDSVPDQISGELWYVAVRWSTSVPSGARDGDPLDLIKYRWDAVHYEEVREQDLDGEPFRDTAGTPFDPKPMFPVSHLKLIIQRAQLGYDMDLALAYANRINKDPFWGQPPGHVKSDLFVASEEDFNGQPYWQVSYGFEFKKDPIFDAEGVQTGSRGWNPIRVANEGPRHFKIFPGGTDANNIPIAGIKKLVVASDQVGVSHNGLVLLDDDGFPLADQANDPMTFIEFRMFDEIDFAPLGLGQGTDPQLDPAA